MIPFEKLTEEEIDAIKLRIKYLGGAEGTIEEPEDIEHVLRFWNANKQEIFNIFGEELILSKDVVLHVTKEEIEGKMTEFLNYNKSPFFKNYNNAFDVYYSDFWKKVKEFQRAPEGWSHTYFKSYSQVISVHMRDLVSLDTLYQNQVLCDTFTFYYGPGDKDKIQIQKGATLMRVLRKIAEKCNIEGFEEFRIKHSQILNCKTLKGKVCLSIHPLDYMTMSDNNYDWDSCMSWDRTEAGNSYRQGTIEMMNSKHVIVAYLCSSEPMTLMESNISWSNKKWRSLFIVDKNLICPIKGYPYQHDELNNICIDWIYELMGKPQDMRHTQVRCDHRNFEIDGQICRIEPVFRSMYNDLEGMGNRPAYFVPGIYEYTLSGPSECICCGADITEEEYDPCTIACRNCDAYAYEQHGCHCVHCGTWIYEDDIHWLDDEPYCDECFDNFSIICDLCSDSYHIDDTENYETLHIYYDENDKDYTSYDVTICKWCAKRYLPSRDESSNYVSYTAIDPECADRFFRYTNLENTKLHEIWRKEFGQ